MPMRMSLCLPDFQTWSLISNAQCFKDSFICMYVHCPFLHRLSLAGPGSMLVRLPVAKEDISSPRVITAAPPPPTPATNYGVQTIRGTGSTRPLLGAQPACQQEENEV